MELAIEQLIEEEIEMVTCPYCKDDRKKKGTCYYCFNTGKMEKEQARHHKYFNKVQNSKNWKYPINKVIKATEKEYPYIIDAVGFFAGGCCNITPLKNGKVQVTAPGYYALIGA